MKTVKDLKKEGLVDNTIYNADCWEAFKYIPDNYFDICITDPPYGLNFRSHWPVATAKKDFIANDKVEDLQPLIQKTIPELFRVLKQDSEVYWFCSGGGSPILAYAWLEFKKFEEQGLFKVKNVLVWDKLYVGLGWDWRFQYETIFQLVKGGGIKNNDSNASNVLRAKKVIPQQGQHPTPKSEEIIWEIMRRKTKEGDMVLDCFNGGGATTAVAHKTHRKFVGIELEEKYCSIAEDRLKQQILI